ncbi:hypothetical protein NMG60_11022746 [Bertholletia excelsa]
MASTFLSVPSSPVPAAANDTLKGQNSLRQSLSSKDLLRQARIRRSYSDNHLYYSTNRIKASATEPKLKSSRSIGIFNFQLSGSILPNSLRSFLFDPETSKDMNITESSLESNEDQKDVKKRANWIERLMELRGHWIERQQTDTKDEGRKGDQDCDEDGDGGCEVDYGDEEDNENTNIDRELFSRLLAPVSRSDAKLFSRLAFLCNMAYVIPEIEAKDLRRSYGLHFVTSSLEKKAEATATKAKLDQDSAPPPSASPAPISSQEKERRSEEKRPNRPAVAYEIAVSAASYVNSFTKDRVFLGSETKKEGDFPASHGNEGHQAEVEGSSSSRVYKSEVAAYVAASTMTAVVAAGEKEKQEAAKDLQSLHSSPCEWFVCDDPTTYTRYFVIQGSDSLSSWQANLFFEPTEFEGMKVLVHRGIYEAAKGIYEQFMPEIVKHLDRHGERTKLQFTGHSLGGSLSLLVNLMLLARKVVKPSALRPVVTFGSPFIFCGGQKILAELGLEEDHVHFVMMHRDIVPRAFACNYPNQVVQLLKRLNAPLRSHPCLSKNKLLYSPMGKIFILQPDENSSPSHPLLPPGSALYALKPTQCGSTKTALRAFLNSPHPLETLSDPTAYGSEGTILRDHDSSNYLKAVNGVLRQHTKEVKKVAKQGSHLWPLLTSPSPHAWSWSHEHNMEDNRLVSKEVLTRV